MPTMRRRWVVVLFALLSCVGLAQERVRDVIYQKEAGVAFTFDVFKPATPNRAAIIWVVSGGWFSRHEDINPGLAKLLTDNGFTVFEVVHGAQPRYKIAEIVKQIRRSVRYIHAHADDFGIDANRIGICGASAGGHLSLMIGGTGDNGDVNSKDSVERASSKVDAVVAIAPPTDFTEWGSTGVMPTKDPKMAIFLPAFGIPQNATADETARIAKELSPITYVTSAFPPVLIVHGDSDQLVPIQQARKMDAAFEKASVVHSLSVIPGGGHDDKTWGPAIGQALAWFKEKLK